MQWLRSLAAFVALAVALLLWADDAEARLEGGPSVGRSAQGTLQAPPVAAPALAVIAANDHLPVGIVILSGRLARRSVQPTGRCSVVLPRAFSAPACSAWLFGHGFVGELGSVASIFGLVFQLALIALLCRLIWRWWSGRNAPAFAGLSPRQLADPYLRSRHEFLPDIEAPPSVDDVAADNHRAVSK